ncbi:MAG TPA: SurA N-terminal domain-containing protein [Paludibacteraceae bacterium]|nr:SurA N-terminal domain-containing protein [Paludibacteraceae bacterium]HQF49618.1 SurA N-terminal domain-containing protein [Paludibacteraceae bacterium]HQJ89385.1 SurA N-terminal domain-containing protein [Paludibacteraceae bacterium]
MAALEKIRNRAGLLIGVVGLALFAFIIGDFLNSGSTYFGMSKNKIGEVEGSEMSIMEFQDKTATFSDIVKMQYNQNPEDADVRDAVWSQFVETSILKAKAEELGLTVPTEEMQEATLSNNPHPMMGQIRFLLNENGQYDPKRLATILSQSDKYADYYKMWLYWETNLKNQMMMQKYQSLLFAALSPTKGNMEALASFDKSVMDFAFVRKNYFDIADSTVAVSDAELKAKYEEMKPLFKTKGYRSVKVIIYPINPSEEDVKDVEANMQESKAQLDSMDMKDIPLFVSQVSDPEFPASTSYITENEVDLIFRDFAFTAGKGKTSDLKRDGQYYKVLKVMSDVQMRPDSVKASRIIVFRKDKEGSQKLADSLMAELNKGANFDTLVKKFSQDNKALVEKGGDMGWMKEGMSGSEDFDEKVFAAGVGQVVSIPVQQAFFLVKVTAKTSLVKKVKIAEIANKIEPSTDTYRNVYDQAKKFVLANRSLAQFEESAAKEGLQVRPIERLAQNQSKVYVLPQAREIIKWAWEHNVGEVSDNVFETPGQYVIAAVNESVEEGFVPMASVKSQLEVEVRKDKKAEILKKELEGKTDLAAVGKVDTTTNVKFSDIGVARIGNEPAILGVAYNMAVDAVSAPIKGNSGVYLIKMLAKKDNAVDANAFMTTQKSELANNTMRSLYQVLMDKSEIEDNRYNFY